jgi:hypothetical protein
MNYHENIDARGGTFNAVGRDLNNIITIGHQTVTINLLAESGQTLQDVAALRTQILPVALGLDSQIHDTLAFPNESKSKATQGDTMGFETGALAHADTTEHTLSKWSYGWGAGKPNEIKSKATRGDTMGFETGALAHADTTEHTLSKWSYGWGVGKPNESKSKATWGDTMGFETGALAHADTTEDTLSKWGYGWGVGKRKKKETKSVEQELMGFSPHPPLHHSNTRTRSSNKANQAEMSGIGEYSTDSGETSRPIRPNGSQSLFMGSAFAKRKVDTSDRLDEMRKLMAKDVLDY